MNVAALKDCIPPPKAPVDAPTNQDWKTAEEQLNVEFPQDYKEFVSEYGVGCIDRFLWLYSPTTDNPHLNLYRQIEAATAGLRHWSETLKELDEPPIDYTLYPAGDGLIAWARTDNADILYWMRRSGRFYIVVQEGLGPDWDEFEMSITEFLIKLLKKDITCNVFPETWPRCKYPFTPLGEHYSIYHPAPPKPERGISLR